MAASRRCTPRIHGGILADRRLPEHRRQLLAAAIAPFELVVVNLYPFAAAAARPGIAFDELVEEIDIGGPSMVRAAAKNHASVAIVTSPARYDAVLAALDAAGRIGDGLRSALAVEAFRHTAAYDARIAEVLPERMAAAGVELPDEPGLPGATDPYPASLTIPLEKVDSLRYGENPHQPAARYRRPGRTDDDGPFATAAPPLQGKALSYNNVLDASAAALIGRALRGPACVIVKHTNPCGAAERTVARRGLAGGSRRRSGVGLRRGRRADRRGRRVRRRGARLDLPRGRRGARPSTSEALAILAGKPNLRLVVDRRLGDDTPRPHRPTRPARSGRPAAPSWSRRPTRDRTTRPAGPWPPAARRPTPSWWTSTSPGASSAASPRTRSCSSAVGG